MSKILNKKTIVTKEPLAVIDLTHDQIESLIKNHSEWSSKEEDPLPKLVKGLDINELRLRLFKRFYDKYQYHEICRNCLQFKDNYLDCDPGIRYQRFLILLARANIDLMQLFEDNIGFLDIKSRKDLVKVFYSKAFLFGPEDFSFQIGDLHKYITSVVFRSIRLQLEKMEVKDAIKLTKHLLHTCEHQLINDKLIDSGKRDLLKLEKKFLKLKVEELTSKYECSKNKKKKIELIHKTEFLENWIFKGHIDKFLKLETELYERDFIDINYQWQTKKKFLLDCVFLMREYEYFRPVFAGKKITDVMIRHFISERYGFGKTGLSQMARKHKPTIDEALLKYFWMGKAE